MANGGNVKQALISVWDKTGLEQLGRFLVEHEIEILSTGGTAEFLEEHDIPVTLVEKVTGRGPLMDGRLKTLDAGIFGAVLADRDQPAHMTDLKALGRSPIDLVVVNLYPFEAMRAKGLARQELVDYIDIGGPGLLRAAAKNHRHVVVLCRPGQYPDFQRLYNEHGGDIPSEERVALAAEVFEWTSGYDLEVASGLRPAGGDLPMRLGVTAQLHQVLRYGENPHQRAGFFLPHGQSPPWRVLHGKELSFNNYADAECASDAVACFAEPAAVIVKHANPCGFGVGSTPDQAYRRALATDPVSSFGGIVGLNRPVDESTARAMADIFLECVVAPEFSPEALAVLTNKKNLRLLEGGADRARGLAWELRTAAGGYLLQERDGGDNEESWEIVSQRKPSTDEMQSMRLGWKMVRFVKSNAIVLAGLDGLLGVGAGQMSRVDSVILAGMKAASSQHDLRGAALASDAFFPFPDGLEEAARLGVTAVIQPGGSVRDNEVIARVDEADMTMIHTHMRHFRH